MERYLKTYMMIGAGGTGSHFIGPALAFLDSWHTNNEEEWEFVIVDGDHFSESNKTRQMFDPQYVGMNKAEALCDMYRQYPVRPEPMYVGKESLHQLMVDGITVFLCVDNFSVRALVQEEANSMKNVVIFNGGNEYHDGMVQMWVREKGTNKTPPLTFLHPEIAYVSSDDRSAMTCAQAMELPGGEQLIIANMAVAMHMLTGLWRYLTGDWKIGWTEMQFDLQKGTSLGINYRDNKGWDKDREPAKLDTLAVV